MISLTIPTLPVHSVAEKMDCYLFETPHQSKKTAMPKHGIFGKIFCTKPRLCPFIIFENTVVKRHDP